MSPVRAGRAAGVRRSLETRRTSGVWADGHRADGERGHLLADLRDAHHLGLQPAHVPSRQLTQQFHRHVDAPSRPLTLVPDAADHAVEQVAP
jgi:hypothetical protein